MIRHPIEPLARSSWSLRETLTAYDAAYIAVASTIDARLLTTDQALTAAAQRDQRLLEITAASAACYIAHGASASERATAVHVAHALTIWSLAIAVLPLPLSSRRASFSAPRQAGRHNVAAGRVRDRAAPRQLPLSRAGAARG